MNVKDDAILADLIGIVKGLTDWEYSGPMNRETRFFADLGFESIDAVALGEAIETHYLRRFPYAEFLAKLGERQVRDITLGDVVQFLQDHLDDRDRQGPREGPQ